MLLPLLFLSRSPQSISGEQLFDQCNTPLGSLACGLGESGYSFWSYDTHSGMCKRHYGCPENINNVYRSLRLCTMDCYGGYAGSKVKVALCM